MASNHRIVTIDGPAGVGKSTMAKRLADALSIPYMDTGAMFRGVAWKLGEGSWDLPESKLSDKLESFTFSLQGTGAETLVCLDGEPLGQEIRTEQVAMWASNVATLPLVRAYLKQAQQQLGQDGSLVAEGRDMGTVIFPQAPYKFFLDATVEVRAQRRFLQLEAMGKPADIEELKEQIAARDHQDRNREVAPLKPADDGIIIDTSELDKEQVFQALLDKVQT